MTVAEPLILATGEQSPAALAIDSTHLFWGTSIADECCAEVRAVPKAGGTPLTVFSAPRQLVVARAVNHQATVLRLSVDADWIFAEVKEREVIPTTEGPDIHTQDTLWRIARTDGNAEISTLTQGYGDAEVHYAEKEILLLKTSRDPKDPLFQLTTVSKATGAATIASFQKPDPLFAEVESWQVSGDTLYVSYSAYHGAADLHCVASAPRAGGAFTKLWCPPFPLRQAIDGTESLFFVNDWVGPPGQPQAGFWLMNKTSGAARLIAEARDVLLAAVDEQGDVLLGTPSLSSTAIYSVRISDGAKAILDQSSDVQFARAVQLDDDRIFFVKGGDVVSVPR